MGVAIVMGSVMTFCFCCRKLCTNANDSERTTTTVAHQPQPINNPYTAALDNRNPYIQNRHTMMGPGPPPGPAVPLLHSTNTIPGVIVPSAPPDLPPAYDTVMEDPNKFGIPQGQIAAEGTDIPQTPPPEYTPEAVVFHANTNSVTMITGSSKAV
ncbi:uncharacterized protein [Amphiura filiformis]|uniref:uncharacterized protein n=1 Tax=Amphiura filiformis TaxID=82378 RepID=UPI003B2154DE